MPVEPKPSGQAMRLAERLAEKGQNLNLFGPQPPSRYDVEELAAEIDAALEPYISDVAKLAKDLGQALYERDQAQAALKRGERIAAHVPPLVWIEAKEKAGFATRIVPLEPPLPPTSAPALCGRIVPYASGATCVLPVDHREPCIQRHALVPLGLPPQGRGVCLHCGKPAADPCHAKAEEKR